MCSGLLLCQLMGPRGHRQKPSPSLTVASGSSPGKTEKGGAPEGGGALPEAHVSLLALVAGKEARTNVLPRRRPRGEKNPKFECPKCIYPFCWGVKAKILPEKEGEKKERGKAGNNHYARFRSRTSQPRGQWFSPEPSMGVEPDHHCLVLAV